MQIFGSVWVRMDMRCQEGVKKVSRRCQAGGVCCHALQEVLNGGLKDTEWPPQRYWMAGL